MVSTVACSSFSSDDQANPLPLGPGVFDNVWRGDQIATGPGPVRPSGYAVLDAQLPGGGWPLGVLIELLQGQSGWHEWRLLLPVLAADSLAAPVVMVNPPLMPFGPALGAQGLSPERLLWVRSVTAVQGLWASEQALRCATVGAVVAWLPQVRSEQLRRLHWAAHSYQKLLFVVRPVIAKDQSSPAPLRLQLLSGDFVHPTDESLAPHSIQVRVLKRRGSVLALPIALPLHHTRLVQVLGSRRHLSQVLSRPVHDAALPIATPPPCAVHTLGT